MSESDGRGGFWARLTRRRARDGGPAPSIEAPAEPPAAAAAPEPQRWLPADLADDGHNAPSPPTLVAAAAAPPSQPRGQRLDPGRWTVTETEPAAVAAATLAPNSSPWSIVEGDPPAAGRPREPDADLPDVHRRAAEAYCRELLSPEAVGPAVEAALWCDPSTEAELLAAVRNAAAERVRAPSKTRGFRQALAVEHERTCDATPSRLAARADGRLGQHERREFERHLAECLPCQAAELREQRAARAFGFVFGSAAGSAGTDAPRTSAVDATASRWAPTAGAVAVAGAAGATAAVAAPPRPVRRRRRRPALLVALAGLAIAAVAAVVIASGASKHVAPPLRAASPASSVHTSTTASVPSHKARSSHHGRAAKTRGSAHRTHHVTAVKKTHKHATTQAPASHATTPVTYTPPPAAVPTPQTSAPAVTQTVTPSAPAPSVTSVSQSSLPATTAPQSGVGGSSK